MSGSGLFSKQAPAVGHLSKGEVADLRHDVLETLRPMAAITVEEFTDPAAGGVAELLVATATSVAVQTVLTAGLLAPGLAKLAALARNLTFTTTDGATGGDHSADAPADVVITGTRDGVDQEETVTLGQTDGSTGTGVKLWNTITSIVYGAGGGAGALVSVGIGDALPLSQTPKTRAGLCAPVREIAAGSVVTNGTLSATNKSYTPNASPDATKDYAVYYEYDASVA